MKFHLLLTFLIAINFLTSSVTHTQEDNSNNQMCLSCIPKNFFGNEDCYKCRKTTSKIGFGVGTAMAVLKLLAVLESFCCNNLTCAESCSIGCGFPAISDCCESRSMCLANSVCLGSTILTGGGIATAICAWNPLCTQEGWNRALNYCTKETDQLLPMQMNTDNNDR